MALATPFAELEKKERVLLVLLVTGSTSFTTYKKSSRAALKAMHQTHCFSFHYEQCQAFAG